MRKQNLSIYDIQRALRQNGKTLSPPAIATILKQEGFVHLPRRRYDDRPPVVCPEIAAVADVSDLNLPPREFRIKFAALLFFLPYLAAIPLEKIFNKAGLPGLQMIPAGPAMRSLLALKLFGNARHSHVMNSVFDEGLALFAGLNVILKRSFLTEYSCRIDPGSYPKLMRLRLDAMKPLGLERGSSFDLDFHTIPFHGEDALVEKHYVASNLFRDFIDATALVTIGVQNIQVKFQKRAHNPYLFGTGFADKRL